MELIKQIKESEAKAREIVDSANKDSMANIDNFSKEREDKFQQAQAQRKKMIENTVSKATEQANQDAEKLKIENSGFLSSLETFAKSKKAHAVEGIMGYLEQL